jgi:hypothetical protein
MGVRTPAAIGTERTAPNGYHYVKCEEGWRLKHHIVFEAKVGRPIEQEIIFFVDGNTDNFDPANIESKPRGGYRLRKRIADLAARIEELQAEKAYYEKLLANSKFVK